MDEIWLHGAVAIAGLIRQRALSSVEATDAFLHRIESVNPSINAVVALAAERALGRGQ